MVDIKSIEAGKYNELLAEALKSSGIFDKPEWVDFVKTAPNRKRPTNEDDFFYKRTASILRQIYIRGIVGVERLRNRYGGRKDRGGKPAKFVKGSGKLIRLILQQAETGGLLKKAEGNKKGRTLTDEGKELLESVL